MIDQAYWFVPVAAAYVVTFGLTVYTGSQLPSIFNEPYDRSSLMWHRISVVSLLSSVIIAVCFVEGIAKNDPHALDRKQFLFGVHSAFVGLLLISFLLTIFVYNGFRSKKYHKYLVMCTCLLSVPVVLTGGALLM